MRTRSRPGSSTFWVDESGEVWKTRTDAMQQETFRTTREEALRAETGAAVDIGLTRVIRLNKPIPGAHRTQEVRYRVEMTDGSSCVFNGTFQTESVVGGYACYQGGGLLEEGGWKAARLF